MNYTFTNSSIVSVNSGTIVLNVSGKTRTFADAKLVSAVDGKIVLDLPEASFKKGTYVTIVTRGNMERTFILSENTDIKAYYHVSTQFLGLAFRDFWYKESNQFRNATPEEIQELNDQLAAKGMQWNPNTMQIEKLRWKPKEGQRYYYVGLLDIPYISFHIWRNDAVDNSHYQSKNCFRTEEEAKVMMEKIEKVLSEN